MRLDWTVYGLELRTPLRISRSVMARRDAVRVVVGWDGVRGHGEVVSSRYYGLDVARITGLLRDLAPVVGSSDSPDELRARLPELPPGVLAAVDAALHDLVALRAGVPVHAAVGVPQWTDVPTAYTIGIGSPAEAAAQAAGLVARGFTVLKVKVGSEDDVARVAAVRAAAPDARLILDPNGGWTAEETVRVVERLTGVDAVEQPLPPGRWDDLAWLRERCPVPLIADEDAAAVADVRALAGLVDGVNVKLAKCGGITAALEIIDVARACGLDVMLGCLVASSLGIAPAVHLTGHARWVDLDGHLLVADDPWTGIGGEDGTLRLAGAPGLGVVAR
ncbi:L-alanine-DL-glutamate epimerase-like enolase superfamily enzyme [Saccharothrix carnea]|uniref:L-alanine-DL-glutamate epimerase-like enolase superfamily enzyme n=1 Tax=Saccharothrix carnea TaxID=1280637 RepID=A0A2P8I514_SACCR|nr:enolase C-terminal domain-like protein [Saccharothrix carnea]PSL53563.1 L-alanine-DL-glutamate epimerase-like enolase superfamily enzyme [Saccharothrix carnea]